MRGAWVALAWLGGGCLVAEDARMNHAPEVEPVRVSTDEDHASVFRLVVHDRDGDVLDVSLGNRVSLREIVQSFDGQGTRLEASAIYRPMQNFNGLDAGWITVSDGIAETKYDFEVEVAPVNDPPNAHPDAFAAAPDMPLSIPAAVVLRNDDDVADRYVPPPEEDAVLRIARFRDVLDGTVEIEGASVVFVPDPGHVGTAGFDYVVTDEEDLPENVLPLTSKAHVRIDVGGPNAVPVAMPDALGAMEGEVPRFWQAELVGNDRDDDGHTLWVIGVANPTQGAVELSDGRIEFTPEPLGSFGEGYGFDYTVTDGVVTAIGHADISIAPWL